MVVVVAAAGLGPAAAQVPVGLALRLPGRKAFLKLCTQLLRVRVREARRQRQQCSQRQCTRSDARRQPAPSTRSSTQPNSPKQALPGPEAALAAALAAAAAGGAR